MKKEYYTTLSKVLATHDLVITEGLLMKGKRLVIAGSIQEDVLEKIHQGIKASLNAWQEHTSTVTQSPADYCFTLLTVTESAADLLHCAVDYCSRYIEVTSLTSTATTPVKEKLNAVFARHGVPEVLVTDNVPRHLKETLRKLQQRIQQRQKDLEQLREAVESHKRSAQTAVEDSERIFTELIRSIERSRSEVTQRIRDQEKTAVSRAEGQMERLEQEIEDLKKRNSELEKLSHTDDHIHFLQSLQSLSAPPEATENISVSFLYSFDGVRESVCQLRHKLEDFCKEEMKKISVTHSNIVPRTREDFLQCKPLTNTMTHTFSSV
ncbi:uncharacterized protein LOC107667419 [Sinocyclocheilus anshuiensis]|uniref:uncharacterized protein LOC107667419 n=1 Tax=Sinocyclocheilus anshuiensis TaxID=1608454 RepID=UPI0007BAD073|nr:PREDICTED: uncharacterized protein LOC107667419 [Sinocyclocheilus anshuiensis]